MKQFFPEEDSMLLFFNPILMAASLQRLYVCPVFMKQDFQWIGRYQDAHVYYRNVKLRNRYRFSVVQFWVNSVLLQV
jgi:hypothetical protein